MRKHIGVLVVTLAMGMILGAATVVLTAERHPHIRAAMRALGHAQRQLERAAHEYGGHRAKALDLIRAAEKELQEALAFANAQKK